MIGELLYLYMFFRANPLVLFAVIIIIWNINKWIKNRNKEQQKNDKPSL